MKHFYNTTKLGAREVFLNSIKNEKQEIQLLRFFEWNCDSEFTCWDIADTKYFSHLPITSIRRGLTNLKHIGEIIETGYKEGRYKNRCNTYKLR